LRDISTKSIVTLLTEDRDPPFISHWFRNCKKYLEEQKKKKGSETSASGINVIELILQYLLVTHGYLIPDL
jgi:hypothetical protein